VLIYLVEEGIVRETVGSRKFSVLDDEGPPTRHSSLLGYQTGREHDITLCCVKFQKYIC
jgi:hypothetical protein